MSDSSNPCSTCCFLPILRVVLVNRYGKYPIGVGVVELLSRYGVKPDKTFVVAFSGVEVWIGRVVPGGVGCFVVIKGGVPHMQGPQADVGVV